MPRFRPALLLVLVACVFPRARAHIIGESSLVVSADEENLAVFAALPLASAAALLPEDAEPLSGATLDRHRPALLAAAPGLCVLIDASGAAIEPQRVLVSIFQEHEVRFHFLYAADVRPARLSVPRLGTPRGDTLCVVSDLRLKTPLRASLTALHPEFVFPSDIP